jgi:hypothetical protein
MSERRELWRRDDDTVYVVSVHGVDNIGMSCDGRSIVMDVRTWHQLMTWQSEYFDRQCELFGAFGSQKARRDTTFTEKTND